MSEQILKLYEITFQEVEHMGVKKFMYSPYLILNQLAHDTRSEADIIDTLDCFNSVLNGEIPSIVFCTDSLVTLEVLPKVTNFYDSPEFTINTPVLFSIPTIDLKEIFLAWEKYVLI